MNRTAPHATAPGPGAPTPTLGPPLRSGMLPRLVRAVLRVPLLYKILVANGLMVVAAALLAGLLSARGSGPESAPLGEVVGMPLLLLVAPLVLVNYVLVRTALTPLRRMEETARRIQRGELDVRPPSSALADPEMGRLIGVLDEMLDALARHREAKAELAARALEAAETERRRIAQELFADTAQTLSASLVQVAVLRRWVQSQEAPVSAAASAGASSGPFSPRSTTRSPPDPAPADPLEALREKIVAALQGIRRIARGLHPPELEELGVAAALTAHARSIAPGTGVTVRVEGSGVDSWLSAEAALAVYRILQEGLANVIRHANASQARIALSRQGDRVLATLDDDGEGFDVPSTLEDVSRSIGLLSVFERAYQVGGRVRIESDPGEGTRLMVEVPSRGGDRA